MRTSFAEPGEKGDCFEPRTTAQEGPWDIPSLDRFDRFDRGLGRSSCYSRALATALRKTFRAWARSFNPTATASNSGDWCSSARMGTLSWARAVAHPTWRGAV